MNLFYPALKPNLCFKQRCSDKITSRYLENKKFQETLITGCIREISSSQEFPMSLRLTHAIHERGRGTLEVAWEENL